MTHKRKGWYDHLCDITDDAEHNLSTWNPVSVVILIILLIVAGLVLIV